MDLEAVRGWLEGGEGRCGREKKMPAADAWDEALRPSKFYDAFIVSGLRVDLIEPGRVLCSFRIPPRLTSGRGFIHGGVVASLVDLVGSAVFYSGGSPTTGVSLEINVSNFDTAAVHEEIEIEGKVLHIGKTTGVAMVELRKKMTGKLIAQGRHAKYLAIAAKL